MSDLRERVASLQEQLSSTSDPDLKASIQGQLNDTKGQLAESIKTPHGSLDQDHYKKDGVVDLAVLEQRKSQIDRQLDRGEGNIDGLKRESQVLSSHIEKRHDVERVINGSRDSIDDKQAKQMRLDVDKAHSMKNDPVIKDVNEKAFEAQARDDKKTLAAYHQERNQTTYQAHSEMEAKRTPAQQREHRKSVDEQYKPALDAIKNRQKQVNGFGARLSATLDDVKGKATEVIGKVKEGLSSPDKQSEKAKDSPATIAKPASQKEDKGFFDGHETKAPQGKGLMDVAKDKLKNFDDEHIKAKAGEMFAKLKEKVNGYVDKICKSDLEKLPLDNEGKAKGRDIVNIAKQPAKDYDGHEKALNAEISKDRKDGKLDVTDNHQKEAVKEGVDQIKEHDKGMKALGKEINDQGLRGERFSIDLNKQAPEIRKEIAKEIQAKPREMEHGRGINR